MLSTKTLLAVFVSLALVLAGPATAAPATGSEPQLLKRCTATIAAYADVPSAVAQGCATITMGGFTVPAGKTLSLALTSGTTVNVNGDITFAASNWDGPLFMLSGTSITFNGGGHTFDGKGACTTVNGASNLLSSMATDAYWDGQGSNGGVTKPKFMKITSSGTFSNLIVLNTPEQAFSIGNKGALTISAVTVNNKAGDAGGGHNTDGFDVSSSYPLTITKSYVYNQDDCLAINNGVNVVFSNNYCSGGHGISIGSIATGKVVNGVVISGNTVVSSTNGLRIKTIYKDTDASVTNVTYTGNTVTSATTYGVVIEQDYDNGSPTGTATNGITVKDINFTGTNKVSVASGAKQVYVLCGSGSCTGTWNWAGLSTSGGSAGSISGSPPITGYTLAK